MNLFKFFYLGLVFLLYIVALPVLLLLVLKEKYRYSIPARFFLYKNPPLPSDRVWFHVCSFGEVRSLKPILQKINKRVNLTVTTQTGYKEAESLDADVRYLPYEIFLPFWVRKQKLLIVSEAELWYMLFAVAKQKGARVLLINARISDNSYESYKRFRFLYRRIFQNIDKVYAQSEVDKKRLVELGARDVEVVGNIKAYGKIVSTKAYPKPKELVLTLASTHKGEELMLKHLSTKDMKLIVVPRHPERFDEVAKLLNAYAKSRDLSFERFSETQSLEADVVLIDAMGELINIYAVSDVVLLGGSFVPNVGGHNPLEPAAFGCKIISGKHYFNQKPLYEIVENIEVVEADEINQAIKRAKPSRYDAKVNIEPIIEEIERVV